MLNFLDKIKVLPARDFLPELDWAAAPPLNGREDSRSFMANF